MNKFKLVIICIILFVQATNTFGQQEHKPKKGIDYQYDVKTVFNTHNLIYYGWDFSQSKLTDLSKIGDKRLIVEKYIPEWMAMMDNRYSADLLKRNFKMEQVTENFKSVQDLYRKMDVDAYISPSRYEISIEKLNSIVKSYDLPEKSGIGFVIIIENFNKPERFVTGYLTFFNIETRKILWATKMKGVPGSKWGFTQYYYQGLVELYDYYIRDYFGKTRKMQKN